MPSTIVTNIMSLNAQRNLSKSQGGLATSLQRLSSGLRINSAKDDAAGLAIAARFTTQIKGLQTAVRNANDGVSLAQVAEGALGEASNMLQRIRQLAVQSINSSNSASDRQAIQAEVGQLTSELDRIAKNTSFNGQKILDGTFGTATFQVGANVGETITATTANFKTAQYGNYRVDGYGSFVGTTTNITAAGSVQISGAGGVTAVNYAANDSAKDIASKINLQNGATGVTATAETEVELTFGASGSYVLTIASDNSSAATIGFSLEGVSGTDALQAAADAFNDKQTITGVTAEVKADGTSVVLTHSDGEDIRLMDTTTANAGAVTVKGTGTLAATLTANTVADTAVGNGKVSFDSNSAFAVTGTAVKVLSAASEGSSLMKVATLDVTSVAGSENAISIVDAALSQISNQRAKFGAIQSRFESAIRNLEGSVENLTAARSRILDTDFAAETANLAKAQILQQASTAMLAQANALPQSVLSLLA